MKNRKGALLNIKIRIQEDTVRGLSAYMEGHYMLHVAFSNLITFILHMYLL